MRQVGQKASRRAGGGFTVFEFAIVLIIMALLTGLLLQRLINYRQQSELAGVERMAAVLRTALLLKAADLASKNRADEIVALTSKNPMDLLAQKPQNYRGEYFSPTVAELPPGGWFFDRKTKTLVYLLNNGKSFPAGTPKSLKFKVKFIQSPGNTALEQDRLGVTNVSLVQVDG